MPDMSFIKKIRTIGFYTLLVLSISCKTSQNGEVKRLTLAAIPSDDMTETLNYVESFSKYLSVELDIPVNYIKATDYTAVIEAMKSHKVDIAMLGPFSYVMASYRADAEALVTLGTEEGHAHAYKSLLITNANSSIYSMDDVKANASDLIVSFTDPASTSGHLIPRAVLKKHGLNAETDFKSMVFSGSHAASILTCISKKTDIAFANNLSWRRVEEFQKLDMSKLRIIWESGPIYPDPVCVPKQMDEKLKAKIKKALIELKTKDTAAWNQFIHYDHAGDPLCDSLRYISIHDSAYNSLRDIARSIDKFDLK
jgi:phosphonate transport system substrate-binding protein